MLKKKKKKPQKNARLIYIHYKIYLNIRRSSFLLNRTENSAEHQKNYLKLNCANNFFTLQTANKTCCWLCSGSCWLQQWGYTALIQAFKNVTASHPGQRCQSIPGFHLTHTLLEFYHLFKQCFIMKEVNYNSFERNNTAHVFSRDIYNA